MKRLHEVCLTGLITLLAVPALAAPRQYRGAEALETFTKALVSACGLVNDGTKYPALVGPTPDYAYLAPGSSAGGVAMRDGTQDFAAMSRPLNQSEACATDIPAGPQGEAALMISPAGSRQENWLVARATAVVVTRQANALRCDTDGITGADGSEATADDFGASLAFNPIELPVSDFPNDGLPRPVARYAFTDWKDVLRVLWSGADQLRTPAEGGGAGQTAANRVSRCNSDIRRSLVASWDNLLTGDGDCEAVAGSCQSSLGVALPLRHVFRADDAAPETDTFLSLLGLNSVGGSLSTGTLGVNQPFCNGTDMMDNDPIRVRCSTNNPAPAAAPTDATLNDETCGVDQTTGLVLSIRVPALIGTTDSNKVAPTSADLYASTNCGIGVFAVRRPPAAFHVNRLCPDAAPYLFTGCLTPLPAGATTIPPTAADECRCVNAWTNRAPGTPDTNPSLPGTQNDGRIWNRILRGTIANPVMGVPGRFGSGTNRCPVLRDERNIENVLADYRMRYRVQTVNALPVPIDRQCREPDSTHALGCLSRASACSIGYANRVSLLARAATTTPPLPAYAPATALLLGPLVPGGSPEGPSLGAIVESSATLGYPLANALYFNSISGLASVLAAGQTVAELTGTGERIPTGTEASSPEQAQLVECLLAEDADLATGPLQLALAASRLLPAAVASAEPFLDEGVRQTCP